MNRKLLFFVSVPVLLILLAAGLIYAQGPEPGQEGSPSNDAGRQVALGEGFTYQGVLKDGDGSPIDDTCDFSFGLWDAESGGTQVGADCAASGVTVSGGYFGAVVNGGGEFGANAFAGEARWLEIAVQCTSDPSPVLLSPRQLLSAAPYALSLQPGAVISGTLAGESGLTVVNSAIGGHGLYGYTSAISGTGSAVYGVSDSTEGRAVVGLAGATSGTTYGVYGEATSNQGRGVYGLAPNYGVYGQAASSSGLGVYGSGRYGVYGRAPSSSPSGRGVYGVSDSTDNGCGVYGEANASSGYSYGVWGQSLYEGGIGVFGYSNGYGVQGMCHSTTCTAVYGRANVSTGNITGVLGWASSNAGRGVIGHAVSSTGYTYGVWGETDSPDGYGVYGRATSNSAPYAGYFYGDVYVSGDLSASGSKPFKIDHPLDPANQYLYHYCTESSEVLNQYSGNAILDESGAAWVELPEWFETINSDFRYQLTCVGGYAPVYIAHKIEDNRFQIAGGSAGLEVSWQVTALRSDPYIQHYGAPVEVDKPADERGTYLYPELYGQPEELGLDYQHTQGWEEPPEPEAPLPDAVPE